MEPQISSNEIPNRVLSTEHIVATPGTCGGKPRIAGTRIRVQDIYVRGVHNASGEGCGHRRDVAQRQSPDTIGYHRHLHA